MLHSNRRGREHAREGQREGDIPAHKKNNLTKPPRASPREEEKMTGGDEETSRKHTNPND